MRENCILNADSPSYPPERDEYEQCGCESCLKYLANNPQEEDKSFERDMCNKYPVEPEKP